MAITDALLLLWILAWISFPARTAYAGTGSAQADTAFDVIKASPLDVPAEPQPERRVRPKVISARSLPLAVPAVPPDPLRDIRPQDLNPPMPRKTS